MEHIIQVDNLKKNEKCPYAAQYWIHKRGQREEKKGGQKNLIPLTAPRGTGLLTGATSWSPDALGEAGKRWEETAARNGKQPEQQ